jgi:hypothetical protein
MIQLHKEFISPIMNLNDVKDPRNHVILIEIQYYFDNL